MSPTIGSPIFPALNRADHRKHNRTMICDMCDVSLPEGSCARYQQIRHLRCSSRGFPKTLFISLEATRQDRSLSWIVQKAWKAARREIRRMPSANGFRPEKTKGPPDGHAYLGPE